MDYWKDLEFYEWDNFKSFLNSAITLEHFYLTTKSTLAYYKADLKNGAYLHFGREDAGLNPSFIKRHFKSKFFHLKTKRFDLKWKKSANIKLINLLFKEEKSILITSSMEYL